MASLSNDLESLSLNLPDVVAAAAAEAASVVVNSAESSTTSRNGTTRGSGARRRNKANKSLLPSGNKDNTRDNFATPDGATAASSPSRAAPLEDNDQRVPDIDFSLLEVVAPSCEQENNNLMPDKSPWKLKSSSSRSKRTRKGGKRKRKAMSSDQGVHNDISKADGKVKDEEGSKGGDTTFPFDNDSDNDEEPKYIWRNVTKNGGIKKCILVDGKMDLGRPKPGDTVLVKSQGKLKDGTIIDDHPSMVFNVGEYEVIDGLDLVVQSMYKNELSIVSIKPELAYGETGRGTRAPCGRVEDHSIPSNSRITYLFGLLHFEKAKEIGSMTWAQRRKSGQSRLRLANWWYQRKDYAIAVKCYKKALECYNDIQSNRECSSAEEYKELLQLMEERLRVMRQVANIFKRIANLIQSGAISV